MKSQDYADLFALEDTLWWFAGMREISAALLDPVCNNSSKLTILDAGCGTGSMINWLTRYAGSGLVAGIDLAQTALGFCRDRGLHELAQASVTQLPFADSSFDLLTSFDVLVQLPNEQAINAALHEIARVLKPGGAAFVRVAAYDWMMSDHDRALGTQHRFTLRALQQKMSHHGLRPMRATYANSLLLPVAILRRKIFKPIGIGKGSDVKPLPAGLRWLNPPLTAALKVEAAWLRWSRAKLPFGLSAICIARKDAGF